MDIKKAIHDNMFSILVGFAGCVVGALYGSIIDDEEKVIRKREEDVGAMNTAISAMRFALNDNPEAAKTINEYMTEKGMTDAPVEDTLAAVQHRAGFYNPKLDDIPDGTYVVGKNGSRKK